MKYCHWYTYVVVFLFLCFSIDALLTRNLFSIFVSTIFGYIAGMVVGADKGGDSDGR